MDETNEAPAVPGVQPLDVLAAEAASLEAGAAPAAPSAAQTRQADSEAAELLGALQMARMMVAPMFGWWAQFGEVWSDQALERIAAGGALVMQRHGWTMGGLMGEFGPYIALAGATLPPSFVTWQAIKAHRAELERAARERPEPAAH
ncbi:hypothetical protein [Piscinibacter sp.]|uniref:hypothetical protein n=1 Tax=Piscinibacter sp. TaxID=1903157 RepID=UPI0039E6165F